MKTSELDYDLPPELIAQQPAVQRAKSRLLVLRQDSPEILDRFFYQIGDFLKPGDCMVLNDTKVIPARFYMQKSTGAKIEGLFLDEPSHGTWHVMLKNARKIKPGDKLELLDFNNAVCGSLTAVEKLNEGQWLLKYQGQTSAVEVLDKIGIMPLPPYIKRTRNGESAENDKNRYQTVFAQTAGAVAAPTAGLHFSDDLIAELKANGIKFAFLTLHVGIGTFKPVTADDLNEHKIHREFYEIDARNAAIINDTKKAGGRIIAVGTTSVRTLETITINGLAHAGSGHTELFVQPGYTFQIVDGIITNFHLPKSTLLALIAAFAGLDKIKAAYKHAVDNKYRFYSYGDAMLII